MAQVTFTYNPVPAPACYPADINALGQLLTNGGVLVGTIPDNSGGGVFVGVTPPSSANTTRVWFKTDGLGRPVGVYMFYGGNWRKVYTGVGIGEVRIYIGTNAVFDGNGLGLVGGDFDGWQLCNGNGGTPNLESYFLVGGVWGTQVGQGSGWFTDADGAAWRSTGGRKGQAPITPNNLPGLQYEFFYQSFPVGTGNFSPNCLVADGSKTKSWENVTDAATHAAGFNSAPLPTPILYYAVAYMMFVGY